MCAVSVLLSAIEIRDFEEARERENIAWVAHFAEVFRLEFIMRCSASEMQYITWEEGFNRGFVFVESLYSGWITKVFLLLQREILLGTLLRLILYGTLRR